MQSQIPKRWYLFSTNHMHYLYLVSCCTCCCYVIYFCMYNLDPTKHTTMFPSTSCGNPLCPILHKVFRNHAAYSPHLNCSTGCMHYIWTGWSATANQSTKSPALLRSHIVNGDTTFGADGIYSSKVETARTDDDFQGFEADDASEVKLETTPNYQGFVNTPHAPQMFAYPGFAHTVDQYGLLLIWKSWTISMHLTMCLGSFEIGQEVPALRNILFTHSEVWIVPAM